MALGIAYLKLGDLPRAKEHSMQALAVDPSSPVALKNLGAILGQEGDSLRALYYLRRSFEADPRDPQTVYGLARNGLREIAVRGLRMFFYLLDVIRLFRGKLREEVREIVFYIGMREQNGWISTTQ